MALVLKSNVALDPSVKPLGDKHGVIGSVDWKYMLDFSNQEYFSQSSGVKQKHEFSDFVSYSRNLQAEIIDKNGNAQIVASHIPRFSKIGNNFGLLIESGRSNYFLNSDAPKTQTVTGFTAGATIQLVCFIEGTGTVTISGVGVTPINVTAYAGNPAIFNLENTNGSASITATVAGNVTFCQITQARGGAKETSRIHTLDRSVAINTDEASLNSLITDSLRSNFTVLMQVVRQPNVLYQAINDMSSVIEIANSANSHFSLIHLKAANSLNSSANARIRSYTDGTEKRVSMAPEIESKAKTYAFSISDNISWARNGVYLGMQEFTNNFDAASIKLGVSAWLGGSGALDGIITKIAIYDRVLSANELETVSRSFN